MDEKIQELIRSFSQKAAQIILEDIRSQVKADIKGKPDGRGSVTPKPCPVCGTPNKARRWRFYCPEHKGQSGAK